MPEVLFIGSILYVVAGLYRAGVFTLTHAVLCLIWLFILGVLSLNGYFQNILVMPPRLLYAVLPVLVIVTILWIRTSDCNIKIECLQAIHIVRIPVEMGLYLLYQEALIPEIMTFLGWNYDIIIGLTAIPVLILWRQNKLSDRLIGLWNIAGIGFLLFIVVISVLSAPLPIQQFAFDQPNVGLLEFPYVGLPACIVPAVLLAHALVLKKLAARRAR